MREKLFYPSHFESVLMKSQEYLQPNMEASCSRSRANFYWAGDYLIWNGANERGHFQGIFRIIIDVFFLFLVFCKMQNVVGLSRVGLEAWIYNW